MNEALLDRLLFVSTGLFITTVGVVGGYLIYLHFHNNGEGGGGSGGSSSGGSSSGGSSSGGSSGGGSSGGDFSGGGNLPDGGGSSNPFSWVTDFFFPKKLEACCEVTQFKVFCVNEPEKYISLWDFFLSFSCDLIVWSQDTAILLCIIV